MFKALTNFLKNLFNKTRIQKVEVEVEFAIKSNKSERKPTMSNVLNKLMQQKGLATLELRNKSCKQLLIKEINETIRELVNENPEVVGSHKKRQIEEYQLWIVGDCCYVKFNDHVIYNSSWSLK